MAWAQNVTPTIAEVTPLDEKVNTLFTTWDKPDAPGCVVAVLKEGKTVYTHGYGLANLEYGIPNSPTSVYCIASVSKQFTACCIHLLALEGKLALDDDVHKLVPELPDFGKPITIRQLIHHTSGLKDYFALRVLSGHRFDDACTANDILNLLWRQKELNFPPGEQTMYSNTGYVLLGLVVKRASGKSLRDYAEEKIFKPLGMTHTFFADDYQQPVKNRAYSYYRSGRGYEQATFSWTGGGEGNLYTTVEDLAKWDQNFYDAKVGGSVLINAMQAKGKLNNGKEFEYASGLVHGVYKRLPIVEHSGSVAGYRTHMLRFPEQKCSVIVLANRADFDPGSMVRRVADVVLEEAIKTEAQKPAASPPPSAPKPTPIPVDPKLLDTYAGEYAFSPSLIRRFVRNGDHLRLKVAGQPDREMISVSETEFALQDFTVRYTFVKPYKPGGKVKQVLRQDNGEKFLGTRTVEEPLTQKQLDAYVGDYYSEELDAFCSVGTRDKMVTLSGAIYRWPLTPLLTDQFRLGEGIQVEFARDHGRVVELRISMDGGRAQRIRFVRASLKAQGKEVNVLSPPVRLKGDPALYAQLSGRYQFAGSKDIYMFITSENGHLYARITGQEALELFPRGLTEFFYTDVDAQMTFVPGPDGKFSELVLHQNGTDYHYRRAM